MFKLECAMSTVQRSRFVIPVLGLLNVVLLVTAVVLGIYCEYKSKVDTTTSALRYHYVYS